MRITNPGTSVADAAAIATNTSAIATNTTSIQKIANNQNLNRVFRFDVNAATAQKAATWLSIPVPNADANNEIVHPSVVIFPKLWNGYRYWMAATPYPASNSAYENPCIYASNDGQTWVVPVGLTNPIEGTPSSNYNSDTELLIDPNGTTLHCLFREVTPTQEIIWLKSSTNGTTWTTKVEVIRKTTATESITSPAFIYDESDALFKCFYVDPTAGVIRLATATSLTGTWSAGAATNITAPAGRELWHLAAAKAGGEYHLLINTNDPGSSISNGALYLAASNDGVNFTRATSPVLAGGGWDYAIYRATMVLVNTGADFRYLCWYSAKGTYWKIAYTEILFSPHTRQTRDVHGIADTVIVEINAAINGIEPYIVGDSFNRADTTAGIGTAQSGQTWTTLGGAPGISSKKAYGSTVANTKAYVNAGVSDGRVKITVSTYAGTGTQAWLLFRLTDTNNYWRFGMSSGNVLSLQKVVAGAVTTTSLNYLAISSGDQLEARLSGSTISIYLNNNLLETMTDSFNASATGYGFQTADTTTRFDNFVVRS